MGSISDYLENKLLDHVFENTAFTVPTNIYIALSTADPLDTGAGISEPVGNGYARLAHNTWDAAASRLTENTGVATFAQATGAWGTISHFALFDAITAGNMLAHGALSESKSVVSGNTPSFADGEIDVSFSAGAIFDYLAHKLLDHTFKTASYTQPGIWVALSTTTPADDGTGITEPSGNAYARVDYGDWSAAASGALQNNAVIQFATPTGTWGTVTYTVIYDALTVGNPLCYGDITDQAISTDDDVEFAAGDFDVTLS